MKVAVDAMGGDYAPEAIVRGAVAAARDLGTEVLLVGDQAQIEPFLPTGDAGLSRLIDVEHAPDTVGMAEAGTTALKRRDSSIARAMEAVKAGRAAAVVSAGNSGAAVAGAVMILGRIPGIERPGIATHIPTLRGATVCIDSGANVECKASQLVEFAIMGRSYVHDVLGVANPTVGLLNIGEESCKGSDMTRQAYALLQSANLNFTGNVEANRVFMGEVDVVICDGFVGNIVLKSAEGLGELLLALIERAANKDLLSRIRGLLARPLLRNVRRSILYDEYGGALLLGVNGVCVIGHGRSNAKAIANAVRIAHATAQRGLVENMTRAVSAWISRNRADQARGEAVPAG